VQKAQRAVSKRDLIANDGIKPKDPLAFFKAKTEVDEDDEEGAGGEGEEGSRSVGGVGASVCGGAGVCVAEASWCVCRGVAGA
jgi:hypothetical protein